MSTDLNQVDQFRLIEPALATGQYSQIWEVTDPGGRRAAMKILLPPAFEDPDQKAMIKQEAKAGAAFDHPNILKYYETIINKEHAYFIMDLFRAPNLKGQIHADLNGVQLRVKRVIELVALALEHMHERGWLHRDVKPENILVNKAGEVRLIDFSLAARISGALGKLFGGKQVVQGTRTYMAPEQIMGKMPVPQTDMYSFGVTIFEMLTGVAPYKGATPKDLLLRHISEPVPAPSSFNPNVTPEMDRLVMRMLAKKPEARHKKIAELLTEVRNVTPFKEAIVETVILTQDEKEAKLAADSSERLDSRRDARRSLAMKEGGGAAPPAAAAPAPQAPAAGAAPVKAPAPVPAPAPAVRPQAGAPQAGAPNAAGQVGARPPGQQPGAPPPSAGQRPPGQPVAGQPAAGQPAAGQPAAGQPAGQQPARAPGAPQPPAPKAPVAPGNAPPAGQRPPARQPMAGQPAAARPSAPAQPPAPAARPAAANPPAPARPAAPPGKGVAPPSPATAAPQGRPAVPPQSPAQPAAARPPQKPAQPPPARKPAPPPVAKPPAAAPADDVMNIMDMPFFDELPPIA